MNSWLLFMLIPLGAAALGSLFDDDDDNEHSGGDSGGGTPPLEGENLDGVLAGTEGDDTITATRDELEATAARSYDDETGFSWSNATDETRWSWETGTQYPEDAALPGLTVVDAGAGNDDISIGVSTYADAGAGNDTISVGTEGFYADESNPNFNRSDLVAAVNGGAGNDVITSTGANIGIQADDGNDTVTASGYMQFIDGGEGADLLRFTGEFPPEYSPNNVDPSALYVDVAGGAGNDRVEAVFDTERSRGEGGSEGDGYLYISSASGDDGDDTLIVSGSGGYVTGGEGDDSLTVSGEQMFVDGGAGADTINIAGLSDSTVVLGSEDSLQGYAETEDIDLLISGFSQFQGTDGDDNIAAETANDIHLQGGDGDDRLSIVDRDATVTDRASTLEGGQGDDTLIGGATFRDDNMGSHGEIRWDTGDSNDLLLGGDGDDLIVFDQADTVTGGAGNDRLIYSADAGSSAQVTDFTAGEDVVTIVLNPEDVSLPAGSLENPSEITVTESDGRTAISLSGNQILSLDGTGLNIGFGHGDASSSIVWTDLNGDEVDPDTLDVLIDAREPAPY